MPQPGLEPGPSDPESSTLTTGLLTPHLRDGELILPDAATFLKELEAEAKFYQIQGILDVVRPRAPKNFEESLILTNEEHRTTLENW